jgi:hypothetical protein
MAGRPVDALAAARPARGLTAHVFAVGAEWPICLYYHAPLSAGRTRSTDDPQWMGTCHRGRFLEAMALGTFAGEPCHAKGILCEPRPNA